MFQPMLAVRALGSLGVAGALVLAAAAPGGPGEQLAAAAFAGPVSARVERVLDGDTIEVTATIWLEQSVNVRVRIDGVDAPELKSECAEERERALAARAFLARRIEGAQVTLSRVAYDKYGGRVRASVSDRDGDIAGAMIAQGLVRPYRGGRRSSWCQRA
ncbi:MAG: thermonuclease family protein [Alphaproteobacteria bacterium]